MPLEQKLALRLDDNNIGYLPIDASIQGASAVHKAIRPNQNESFLSPMIADRTIPVVVLRRT